MRSRLFRAAEDEQTLADLFEDVPGRGPARALLLRAQSLLRRERFLRASQRTQRARDAPARDVDQILLALRDAERELLFEEAMRHRGLAAVVIGPRQIVQERPL